MSMAMSRGPLAVPALWLERVALTNGGDLVQFSEYTSTFFYRAWLLQAIANVERGGTD